MCDGVYFESRDPSCFLNSSFLCSIVCMENVSKQLFPKRIFDGNIEVSDLNELSIISA